MNEEMNIINEEVVKGGLLNSKLGKATAIAGGVTLVVAIGALVYNKVIKKKTKNVNNEESEVNE